MQSVISTIGDFFNSINPTSAIILSNGLIVSIAAWLGKWWTQRQLQRLSADQARQLEITKGEIGNIRDEFKVGLDKKMMIFKTHFELEFSYYKQLWSRCDEAFDLAARVPAFMDGSWSDKETVEEQRLASVDMYEKCRFALGEIRTMRPFISKEVADLSRKLARDCLEITQEYMRIYRAMHEESEEDAGYWDRKPTQRKIIDQLNELDKTYGDLADLIASRIQKLYVIDFGKQT